MVSVVSRDYCLSHPIETSQLYGLDVFVSALLNTKRTVLEQIASSFSEHRLAMPGPLGESYRLSELCELRAARIYQAMAERFRSVVPAQRLFRDLEREEEEHARLMHICLYTVRMGPAVDYVPSVRDAEVRAAMKELRAVQHRVPSMTLDEALRVSEELERGEANLIFGKLLKQVAAPEVDLLKRLMRHAENHQESVPRRIAQLRQELGALGMT